MVKEPEDWERKTVGDCSLILQGGTPSTLIGKYWDGDVTWVTPSDISRLTGMWITNSERNLSPAGIAHSSAVILPEKTILLCTRATIGALALTTRPMATNQGFKNLVCKPGVDPVFLAYLLTAKTDEMKALSVGTTFLELSKKNLSEIPLRVPPHSEQRAIAEVLSGFDEHLANLDELITKKKAIRDGVLDELLTGKQRLFGFNGGWSSLALEEVAAIYDGVHQTPDYEASGIRFVSVEDVFDLYGSAKFISQTSYLRDFKVPPSKGDVLMTRIGDIGTPAYISDEEPLAYYVSLALLKPIRINGLFLYYYIQSKSFQREVFDRSLLHATPKKINKGEIGFCLVTMPRNLEEQRAIASVLSSIDEEIRLLAEERAKVERLKLGAMDDLLTGRVRLPLAKEAA